MVTTKLTGAFREYANTPKGVLYLLSIPRRKKGEAEVQLYSFLSRHQMEVSG